MSHWSAMPSRGVAGLGLLAANVIGLRFAFGGGGHQAWRASFLALWLVALTLPTRFLFGLDPSPSLETFALRDITMMVWLVAAATLPIEGALLRPVISSRLKFPILAAALFAAALMVATAWVHNFVGPFRLALAVTAIVLLQCKLRLHLPFWLVQVANTALLLVVGLPVADLALRPWARGEVRPDNLASFYSYTAARKDPAAYDRWWSYYAEQWQDFSRGLITFDQTGPRLRTNAQSTLISCPIATNSRGFRGREFPADKGDAYRIVVLGESTTFGITLNATDRPWPELLEDLIREQIKPRRPVEVINAGVPAITLPENVARLPAELLPLQPDLIISYHGINGFHLLIPAMPSLRGDPPPRFRSRPLKLMAEAEYGWRLRQYKRHLTHQPATTERHASDPMKTEYADAYRQLIELAASNHISLVLVDYVMAVNGHSESEAIEFYRVGYPSAPAAILANEIHSTILDQRCREHPAVHRVDPRIALDGQYDYFIDLVHFTQAGRQKLAEEIFASIRSLLEPALAQRPP